MKIKAKGNLPFQFIYLRLYETPNGNSKTFSNKQNPNFTSEYQEYIFRQTISTEITVNTIYFQTTVLGSYDSLTYSIKDVCIYEGEDDKPYEPYGAMPSPGFRSEIKNVGDNGNINIKITNDADLEQTFNLEVEDKFSLKAVKGYEDSFVRKSDGWYKEEKVGKWVLDGVNIKSYQFVKRESFAFSKIKLQGIYTSPDYNKNQKGLALCTHFIQSDNQNIHEPNKFALWNDVNDVYFFVDVDMFQDINEFNNWLKENNVTVIGALATPNYIKCPDKLSAE